MSKRPNPNEEIVFFNAENPPKRQKIEEEFAGFDEVYDEINESKEIIAEALEKRDVFTAVKGNSDNAIFRVGNNEYTIFTGFGTADELDISHTDGRDLTVDEYNDLANAVSGFLNQDNNNLLDIQNRSSSPTGSLERGFSPSSMGPANNTAQNWVATADNPKVNPNNKVQSSSTNQNVSFGNRKPSTSPTLGRGKNVPLNNQGHSR